MALLSCELVRSMSVRMYPVGAANSCFESKTSRGSILGDTQVQHFVMVVVEIT